MTEVLLNDLSFDLENYIGKYTSRTQIDRLLYIAKKFVGTRRELDALKLAADILKQGVDVKTYEEVIEKIGGRLGAAYKLDMKWIEQVENNNRLKQDELNSQLHAFMANLAKEGMRIVYNDLAAFYYDTGRFQDALKEYQRTKDYCSTPKHSAGLYLNALKITLETKTFAHLVAYIRRTESLPKSVKTRVFNAKVSCFHGLKELEARKYGLAARHFIEIHPEIGDTFNEVATAYDMATYGALCALASFNRDELKTHVLSNVDFKELMEHNPEIKECVRDFQRSEYNSCFGRLGQLLPFLSLDIYLGPHITEIYHLIRQKALVQYTIPFSTISLHPMAEAFNVSIIDLEKDLVGLIMKEEISARVDSENKILYAKQSKSRNRMFQNAKSLTKSYLQDHKSLLIRLNLIKHDLVQKQISTGDRKSKRNEQQGSGSQTPSHDELVSRIL